MKKNTWCKACIEEIINNSEARLNEQEHLSGKPDPKKHFHNNTSREFVWKIVFCAVTIP